MDNKERYDGVFTKIFNVEQEQLATLEYKGIESWDSVGQMELLAGLEDEFGIFFEMDDMMDLNSYVKGIEILKKYDVEI